MGEPAILIRGGMLLAAAVALFKYDHGIVGFIVLLLAVASFREKPSA